ncbi:MAG TPA: response regulator transcription factor [Pseudonocardiaceae bacterium]|nr:response regulator transcription factor [Pseudonocardiaceae bacterium]
MPSDAPVRVVLAEDGALLREGLRELLAQLGFTVVAVLADAENLRTVVAEQSPDLVITDIRMPPTFTDEGLRAAIELRAEHPGLAVVALSQYVRQEYAADLLESGVGGRVGYLLKDRVVDVAEFVTTLRRVLDGETVVDPEVVRELLLRQKDPLSRLSPREHEVLALIAQGLSNTAIAESLVVSEAAVSKHVRNIFAKLSLPPTLDASRRVMAALTYLRLR